MKKRFWALFLAVMMVVSVLPTSAFAEEAETAADEIIYGEYVRGNWEAAKPDDDAYDGEITDEESGITLSKRAKNVGENTYEITLEVETSTTTTTVPAKAATVLVIDESISMRYCADCGCDLDPMFGMVTHERGCDKPGSRMAAAKEAALSFLSSYGGVDAGSERYLAIVTFSDRAEVALDWQDVSGGEEASGYKAAEAAIDALAPTGYTNLDAGLAEAEECLDETTVINIENRFVVALTDGIPNATQKISGSGTGTSGSKAVNDATAITASSLRESPATVYTVCFGAEDSVCYNGGPTVGEFLEDSIATQAEGKTYAYNAANADELADAFESITEAIVTGLLMAGAIVTDPMTSIVDSYTVIDTPAGVDANNDVLEWTLSSPSETYTEGNTTYYIYSISYIVKLDTAFDGFVEGEYYPTNERTSLMLPQDKLELQFPVPAVKGTTTYYTVTWKSQDGTETLEKDEAVAYGEKPSYESAIPTKEADDQYAYEFAGWATRRNQESGTEVSDLPAVKDDKVYYAAFAKIPNEYTVTWLDEDGTELATETYTYGAMPSYKGNTPTKEATAQYTFEFAGWTPELVEVTEDAEYTATYTETTNEYTVTWLDEDGTELATETYTYGAMPSYKGNTPTKEATGQYTFEFAGWDPEIVEVTEDAEYTATYTETTNKWDYTVEYYYDNVIDGSKTVLASAEYGSKIETYADKCIEGYKLDKVVGLPLIITEIATNNRIQVYYVTKNTDVIVNKDVISVTSPADQPAEAAEEETKWTAKVGDTITWNIKVENKGNVEQTLTLEDILSNGATDVTVVDIDGNAVTTFTLDEGETVEFTATYVVKESDRGLELINTAVIKDGDQKKDEDPAPGVVVEDPKVSISKVANDTSVYVGDKVTYTITVKNEGNVELTGVKVTDTFVAGGKGKLTVKSGDLEIGTLAVGETATIVLEYTTVSDDVKGLKNKAEVDTNEIKDVADTEEVKVTKKNDPVKPVGPSKPALNKADHYAYIVGYPDGLVHPEKNITRAEVSTIFFRMLLDESREDFWAQENWFSDVPAHMWFNNAVSTLANAGLITGYPDGSFKPNANITRAEFATIAIRFFLEEDVEITENNLSDVKGHWAEANINLAYALNLINGYPDGTFRPDQKITRAEAMTIVNRVLERAPEKDHLLDDMIEWPDNMNKDAWYYAAVQEATNSHEFYRDSKNEYEVWTELLPVRDWAALEREWSQANSSKNPGEVVDINISTPEAGN